MLVHPRVLHLPPERRLDCIKVTGEIKERDSPRASRGLQVIQGPVQQVDDRIIHPEAWLVRENVILAIQRIKDFTIENFKDFTI